MKTFPEFWDNLIANDLWYDQVKYKYGRKNIKDVAQKFYIDLLAQPQEFQSQNYDKWRRTFQKWLMWEPDAVVAPQLQQEEVKIPEPVIEISEEEKQRRYKEWYETVLQSPILKPAPKMSRQYFEENGQWEPKKEGVHLNGIDHKLLKLKETIKKYANRKYKGAHSFLGFSTYKFGLVEVFAANEDDAKDILKKAERYVKLKV